MVIPANRKGVFAFALVDGYYNSSLERSRNSFLREDSVESLADPVLEERATERKVLRR